MKSDSQVQQDVSAELKWEPAVNAAQIGVEVKNGIVTLAGHVDSFGEKWHAERAAQRVAGVKALAVEIDVKLPGSTRRSDADIAASAENALKWTTFLPADAVKIMVEGGCVTLSGELPWEYQRQMAAGAVRYLRDVTAVRNQIVIKPGVTANGVKTEIEAALKRRAGAQAHRISVEVSGGDVTLTGTVHSWSERDLARNSAWGTPGVHHVVDHMTIVA